jgi:hypothetical protein
VVIQLRSKLRTAADALAVGGFLILLLTIWPFWLVLGRYLPVPLPTRSFSNHR